MKDVVSELLERKEQREEDDYFESLNREVIEKLQRQTGTGERSASGPPGQTAGPGVQPPDTGR